MGAPDLCAAVLASRGSVQREPRRTRLAAAVCRAALEAERGVREPRFFDHRGAGGVFIAATLQAAEYAEALGRRADRLAAREPLASPLKAIEALREIPLPAGPPPILKDNDLLTLAVYASRNAALSSRLEIYPRGMSAIRMVRLARGTLAGVRELTVRELHQTISGRYPRGETLPDRPALDRLIDRVGLERIWRPDAARGQGAYCYKHGELFSETSDSTFTHAGPDQPGKPPTPDGEFEARLFDRKVAAAYKEGAFLVLTAPPHRLAAARDALMERFDLKPVDFDALFIPALKKMAEEKEIQWQVVLDADAAPPTSPDGDNLRRLVALCMPEILEALSVSDKTILLTGIGLLARYGQLELLEELRERVGVTGGALEGLWILIPTGGRGQRPMVDDAPIPVLGSAQYARIPEKWA